MTDGIKFHSIKSGVFERRHFMGEEATCIAITPPLDSTQVETVYNEVLLPHGNAYIGERYSHDNSGVNVTEIHLYTPENQNHAEATAEVAEQVATVLRGMDGIIAVDSDALPYITESGLELFQDRNAPHSAQQAA